MDFRLSIGSNLPREELGKLLYDMLCEVFFVELIDYEAEVWASSYTERINVGCTYFSMSIDLDAEEDYIEYFREMNREAYGVNTNVLISIQFISSTFEIGWVKLLEVIGKLLRLNDQDLVLEDDAPDSLLKRIKGSLLIKGNLDEYQTWLMSKENLSLLDYPYKEEDFSK
ncbi:hypothetical protein [Paenibacillus sanfengchensis]|uniref:hypothetical protein n=1 Tax=Paenibacillus sanfengchensis TaxID=3119819 RepID=UPI002FE112DC